ncbi:MAG: DinB family protein [Candidatus Heimdallarchaeota archaeon]
MDSLYLLKYLCYMVENQTRWVCQNVTDDDARWRPENSTAPAIGWLVGHILVWHDLAFNHRFCGNEMITEELTAFFGWGTPGDFPLPYNLESLFGQFKLINAKIAETLDSKNQNWLDKQFDYTGFPQHWHGKSIGKGFLIGVNHSLAHTGQILEIKRQMGKGAWGS